METIFYSNEDYNLPQKEKEIEGAILFDLRYADEFELQFTTQTLGECRFGKKYDPANLDQLNSILTENLGYSGVINYNGTLYLNEKTTINNKSNKENHENNETKQTEYNDSENTGTIRNADQEQSSGAISVNIPDFGHVQYTNGLLFPEGGQDSGTPASFGQPGDELLRSGGNDISGVDNLQYRGNQTFRKTGANQRNYIFSEEKIRQLSKGERYTANLAALKLLLKLQQESREATQEEKDVLAQYSGFGGLSEILYEPGRSRWFYKNISQILSNTIQAIYDTIHELDPDESKQVLAAVQNSVLSAYYTPTEVTEGIYDCLSVLDYAGGRILEPSMGTGRFLGTMPVKFKDNSQIIGVEIDYISGQIAKLLYPDANVQIKGLQETLLPNNSFDIIIGNIPFGNMKVFDPGWKSSSLPVYKFAQQRIHNYFIIKNIELAKQGGIISLITSSATLDSPGNAMVREYIAENSEFLGAIRLPHTTFKNTQTEVTTDILFLRKFEEGEEKKQKYNFLSLVSDNLEHKDNGNIYNLQYNEYYHDHPEMMLGIPAAGGQYQSESFILLGNENQNLRELIAGKASAIVPKDLKVGEHEKTVSIKNYNKKILEEYIQFDRAYIKDGNLGLQNGILGIVKKEADEEGEQKYVFSPITQKVDKKKGIYLIRLRNTLTRLMFAELADRPDEELDIIRISLNQEYESFNHLYGRLNKLDNKKLITLDVDAFSILALEKYDKSNKFIGLADIFSQRTLNPNRIITHADSPEEAIQISLNELGKIVPGKMEQLLGANWIKDCEGLLYELPDAPGNYIPANEYLSGNVREKLIQAKAAAACDERFKYNVTALEGVIPRDIPAHLIDIRLGARWVPTEDYTEFVKQLFNIYESNKELGEVFYNPAVDEYDVGRKGYLNENITTLYAAGGKNGLDIVKAALQDKEPKIYYKDDEGRSIFDPQATQACAEKIREVKDKFHNWLHHPDNEQRLERLARRYNDIFNATVITQYDGSHLTFPGYVGPELRPHQKDATCRILRQDGGVIDHCVGAGKTLVMVTSIMEMRRTGIHNKPMIVALKSTIPQIATTFRSVYPLAKVLAPNEQDFSKSNRKNILGRIAVNDWDCIILSHEQYCMLGHDAHNENMIMQEELDMLRATIEGIDGNTQLSKKQRKGLEIRIENLTAKIQEVLQRPTDPFSFEKLGIDHLLIDESHSFKNLAYSTKHSNVAGLGDPDGSKKTTFLLMGCRALQDRYNDDKCITFLSGTPISNSLVELYLIFRYLRPNLLQARGLTTFDAWASVFAERSSEIEFTVTGELKFKDRFRRYTNVPELAKMYAELADVRNDKNLILPKPKLDIQLISIAQSEQQQYYMREIIEFAKTGESKELGITGDNKRKAKMLVATGLSAKVAMDVRLIDPDLDFSEQSKIYQGAKKVAQIYRETEEHKGVQLVFSDLGTPKGNNEFNVYDEFKRLLIEQFNIPADKIAFIHDVNNDKQREELYRKVCEGEIRILLGSTQKMGTGVNVQDRIVALHHLDVPWTPAYFDQRNGRGGRQGNWLAELILGNKVPTYVYAVEKSLDAYKYQLLDIKQNMIDQVKDGSIADRCIDEGAGDDGGMGFAEFVAQLSGNPIILEKAQVDKDLHTLYMSQRIFEEEKYHIKNKLSRKKITLDKLKNDVSMAESDLDFFKKNGYCKKPDGSYNYHVNIDGHIYDKPSDAGNIILQKIAKKNLGKVLTGYGVDMYLTKDPASGKESIKYSIIAPSGLTYGNKEISENPTFAGMAIINAFEQIERIFDRKKEIPEGENEIKLLEDSLEKEWDGIPQLNELLIRQKEILRELENIDRANDTIDIPHEEIQEHRVSGNTRLELKVESAEIKIPIDDAYEDINTLPENIQKRTVSGNTQLEPNATSIEIEIPIEDIPKELSAEMRKYIGEHHPSEIVSTRRALTKQGNEIWLTLFGVTFDYDVYKQKVEPLFKENGVWNKYHKGILFKTKDVAESFENILKQKIIGGEIPFTDWKYKAKNTAKNVKPQIKI